MGPVYRTWFSRVGLIFILRIRPRNLTYLSWEYYWPRELVFLLIAQWLAAELSSALHLLENHLTNTT
jgi:hypothetical protein